MGEELSRSRLISRQVLTIIQNMNPTTAKTTPIMKSVLDENAVLEARVRGSICPPVPCRAQSGQAVAVPRDAIRSERKVNSFMVPKV
jgi:hypothetical protein